MARFDAVPQRAQGFLQPTAERLYHSRWGADAGGLQLRSCGSWLATAMVVTFADLQLHSMRSVPPAAVSAKRGPAWCRCSASSPSGTGRNSSLLSACRTRCGLRNVSMREKRATGRGSERRCGGRLWRTARWTLRSGAGCGRMRISGRYGSGFGAQGGELLPLSLEDLPIRRTRTPLHTVLVDGGRSSMAVDGRRLQALCEAWSRLGAGWWWRSIGCSPPRRSISGLRFSRPTTSGPSETC